MTEQPEEPIAETPEDVAILYSWANLHGAKYRDFSASRREYRAQVRHRAAEELRQSELAAQAAAEAAAAEAERMAREAERAARTSERFENPLERERALREAEEASSKASAERVEAARRAEAAAMAEATARREEREIAEAHASAQRQEARWNDSEVRRRTLAGPQPVRVPALGGDPYEQAQGALVDGDLATPNRALEYTQPERYESNTSRSGERRRYSTNESEVSRPRGFRPDHASGVRTAFRFPAEGAFRSRITGNEPPQVTPQYAPQATPMVRQPQSVMPGLSQQYHPTAQQERGEDRGWQAGSEPIAPAWLFGGGAGVPPVLQAPPPTPIRSSVPGPSAVSDTLQHSRERVASRWFALKGVFDSGKDPQLEQAAKQKELLTPALAIFSLAGGVGKTSMVATLGRALSSLGEKVLLADTTSHGLLPYYFGATELKPGVVRTFSPPSGSTDAPIHLVSYDISQSSRDEAAQNVLVEEITHSATGVQRILIDFNSISGWLIRRLPRLTETILIPVAPDMNSVISLQSVEKYFRGALDQDGQPLLPFYVINQFDASLPLHLDVREVLKRQLGDRLLPFVIRRSPAVSEALAEGMTVIDYQPEGPISEDFLNVAKWLRSISAPAAQRFRTTRWSER